MTNRRQAPSPDFRRAPLYGAPFLFLVLGCGVLSPEEQLLTAFFEASRAYDTSVASKYAAVIFNPRTDGIVESFDVEKVDRGQDASEQVTIAAQVRTFDGRRSLQRYVVTLTQRDGRPFIVALRHL